MKRCLIAIKNIAFLTVLPFIVLPMVFWQMIVDGDLWDTMTGKTDIIG